MIEDVKQVDVMSDQKSLSVIIHNDLNACLSHYPVAFGVPFPKGCLQDASRISIPNSPVQCTPLSYWPDKSLKWVLVHSQVNLTPGDNRIPLHFDDDVSAAKAVANLKIHQTDESLCVNTGNLICHIPSQKGKLIESLEYDGKCFSVSGAELLEGSDLLYRTIDDDTPSLTIERQGPLYVCVRKEIMAVNELGDRQYRFIFRLHFHAGKPYVSIQTTMVNEFLWDQSLVYQSKLCIHSPYSIPAVSHEKSTTYNITSPISLMQMDRDTISYTYGDGSTNIEGRLDSPILLSEGDIVVAANDMWQNYPQGVRIDGCHIEYELWPLEGNDLILPQGMAKTQTVHLGFGSSSISDIHAHSQLKVIAATDPEWTCKTNVFGHISPPRTLDSNAEKRISDITDKYVTEQHNHDWYGWIDFGDIRDRNCEADYHHGLFLQYVRTGDPKHYKAAVRMARHFMDIDVKHFDTNPLHLGGVYSHRVHKKFTGHTAGAFNACHCWVNGLIDCYYLSGDDRAREVAEEIGQFLLKAMDENGRAYHKNDYHGPQFCSRDMGRILDYLCLLWQMTENDAYLNGATKAFHYVCSAQLPEGGWHTLQLPPGIKRPSNSFFSEIDGMCTAIVLGGLVRYHEVTESEEAKEVFLRGIDHMIAKSMTEANDGFLYGTYPGHGKAQFGPWRSRRHYHPFSTTEMIHWLAEAFRFTGENKYLAIAETCYNRLLLPTTEWEANTAQIHLPYYLQIRSHCRSERPVIQAAT